MKQVEFFGISGSGKTYLKNLLKKRNNFFDYIGIIKKFLPKEEKNLLKKNLIKIYLSYKSKKKNTNIKNELKFKNKKKNKQILNLKKEVVNLYINLLNQIYKKFKKKNLLFSRYTEKLIENSNFSEKNKKVFLRWFKEEATVNYLINKNKKKIKLVINSEGFLQRLFVYLYKKKNKKKILEKYIKLYKLPDLILVTKNKIFLKKKHLDNELNLNILEQKKIYKLILNHFNKNKINFRIISKKEIKKLIF